MARERLNLRFPDARMMPVYRCEDCKLSYVANRDGKVACPRCGAPPAAGIPIANATVTR